MIFILLLCFDHSFVFLVLIMDIYIKEVLLIMTIDIFLLFIYLFFSNLLVALDLSPEKIFETLNIVSPHYTYKDIYRPKNPKIFIKK